MGKLKNFISNFKKKKETIQIVLKNFEKMSLEINKFDVQNYIFNLADPSFLFKYKSKEKICKIGFGSKYKLRFQTKNNNFFFKIIKSL